MKNHEVKALSFWFGFLILLLAMTSCKTKSLTVEKSVMKDKEYFNFHFDSLFQVYSKTQFDLIRSQSSLTENLKLSTVPVLDSSGNRKPLHYKHYVDGQLKEEIFLEGGTLEKEITLNKSHETEHKTDFKEEKARIEVDIGQKIESQKSSLKKNKQVEVKGFQFGFYLWLFVIIIVLIVLYWIQKRLKLPDKIKSIFGNKGG